MKKKELKENVKYRIVHNSHFTIYAIKTDGLISIRYEDEKHDCQWLNGYYCDVQVLLKSDDGGLEYCYLLLEEDYDHTSIIEIISKKVVKSFDNWPCLRFYRRVIEKENKEVKDVVITLLDVHLYALWSLMEGYLFGPHEYGDCKLYDNGVILDEELSVDDTGDSTDISSYKELNANIFYSEEKDDYLYFVNEERILFLPMSRDKENENIVSIETENWICSYDIQTNEINYSYTSEDNLQFQS